MKSRSQRKSRGFTLIEILIAVAILAAAVTVLALQFGSSATGMARLEDRTRAWLIASDKLVELQVYQQWPGVGSQDERREVDGRQWLVRTQVAEGPYPDTRRVDIRVGPVPEFGQEFYAAFTETSLIGKPFSTGEAAGQGGAGGGPGGQAGGPSGGTGGGAGWQGGQP